MLLQLRQKLLKNFLAQRFAARHLLGDGERLVAAEILIEDAPGSAQLAEGSAEIVDHTPAIRIGERAHLAELRADPFQTVVERRDLTGRSAAGVGVGGALAQKRNLLLVFAQLLLNGADENLPGDGTAQLFNRRLTLPIAPKVDDQIHCQQGKDRDIRQREAPADTHLEGESDVRSDSVDVRHGAAHQPKVFQLPGKEIREIPTNPGGGALVETDAGAEERLPAGV